MLLRHLRYLVAVVEHGGFTRAAEALHVSQPTLSQQVQQLEQRLGFNLLDRTGRIVRATDEGEAYLHHVRRAFAELKAAEQAVADVRGLGRGVLRIGITPTFNSYFVGPVINAFGTRFPGIKTQLEVTTQDRLESELEIDRLGEVAIAVGEHQDLVVDLLVLAPGAHDEGVVHRKTGDRVDALRLERVGVLNDRGNMHLVAGAGEGAGHREQRDFLAFEDVVGSLPRRSLRRHHAKFRLRHSIADFDRHVYHPLLASCPKPHPRCWVA